MQYKVSEKYTWKPLKQSVVILNLNEGSYITLNDTASLIWTKLMDGLSADEIAKCMLEEFDCEESEALSDVKEYIESCLSEGLLVEVQ